MRAYEAEADVYQVEMQDYQERYLEWELTRAGAVEAAEGLVGSFHGDYGWTFVDKQNLAAYLGKTLRSWFALTAIVAVLLLGVLWMVKRKDEI
jgi:hypothetical protein